MHLSFLVVCLKQFSTTFKPVMFLERQMDSISPCMTPYAMMKATIGSKAGGDFRLQSVSRNVPSCQVPSPRDNISIKVLSFQLSTFVNVSFQFPALDFSSNKSVCKLSITKHRCFWTRVRSFEGHPMFIPSFSASKLVNKGQSLTLVFDRYQPEAL